MQSELLKSKTNSNGRNLIKSFLKIGKKEKKLFQNKERKKERNKPHNQKERENDSQPTLNHFQQHKQKQYKLISNGPLSFWKGIEIMVSQEPKE